ncbi:MAG: hypothetical protein IT462_13850 [Planctomycetes bacterium]|nr:hypothetical protein [Planctomycetota bacterium]
MPRALHAVIFALIAGLAAQSTWAQLTEDERARLDRNLSAARTSIQKKQHDDAVIALKAVLTLDVEHQEALVLLAESLSAQLKAEKVLAPAIAGFDAPRRGGKTGPALASRAQKLILATSPTLNEFLVLRTGAVGTLLKLALRAKADKRPLDEQWTNGRVATVFPCHEDAEKTGGVGYVPPRRAHLLYGDYSPANAKFVSSGMELGFVDLMDQPDLWQWSRQPNGCEFADGAFKVVWDHESGYITLWREDDSGWVNGTFTCRFSMYYTRDDEDKFPQFMIIGKDPEVRAKDTGILIVPAGSKPLRDGDSPRKPEIAFASYTGGGKGWSVKTLETISKDDIKPKAWNEVSLTFDEDKSTAILTVNGKQVFSQGTGELKISGYLTLAVAEAETTYFKSIRIKKGK